jgi:hypothetical protein
LGFSFLFSKYDVHSEDRHVDWCLHVHLDACISIVQCPVLVCRALRAEGNDALGFLPSGSSFWAYILLYCGMLRACVSANNHKRNRLVSDSFHPTWACCLSTSPWVGFHICCRVGCFVLIWPPFWSFWVQIQTSRRFDKDPSSFKICSVKIKNWNSSIRTDKFNPFTRSEKRNI